jgi:hypothetical protein
MNVIWKFVPEDGSADSWQWRCMNSRTGSLIKSSSRGFSTLWECAEDAMRHGYVRDPAQMAASFFTGLSHTFRVSL